MFGYISRIKCPVCGKEMIIDLGVTRIWKDKKGDHYIKFGKCEGCDKNLLVGHDGGWVVRREVVKVADDVGELEKDTVICY